MRYAVHAPKTPQPMTATSQARSSIVKLDLHDVAVSQTVRVAKRDVGGDLDDRLGVTAEARVGTVRSQKKGLAPEDAAGHQVYVYRPTVFLFFQSQHMGGQRIRFIEADVQRAGEKVHAGFVEVVIVELVDPVGEIADAADDHAPQPRHLSVEYCTCIGALPAHTRARERV